VRSVVWATGYRRAYPWLHVPVLGRDGDVVQRRGVTPAPGLYVAGMRFQHRRGSAFLDGVRHDARDVVGHLAATGRRAVA
jgi:putative flavoprotein involved in K+ transport